MPTPASAAARIVNGSSVNDIATTASFTPPDDCFLVAEVASEDPTWTVTDSTGMVWTEVVRTSGATHIGALWISTYITNPVSMTVAADNGQGGLGPGISLKVYSVTGCNPNDPIGATGSGTSTTNNLTADLYTSTVDGSRGMACGIETAVTGGGDTAPTSTDVEDSEMDAFRMAMISLYKAADTSTASTVVTGNFDASGTATAAWKWAAFELLPPSPPDAPTIISVSAGHERGAAQWTDGATGGSAITGHKIRHATAAAPTTWLGTTDTSSTDLYGAVTGLTNATGYVFQVLAYNAIGDGAWSATSGTLTPVDDRGVLQMEDGSTFEFEDGTSFELESGAAPDLILRSPHRRQYEQLLAG
jgi:hypothetical protein